MKRVLLILIAVLLGSMLSPRVTQAATPIGSLDVADSTVVAGWAIDNDRPNDAVLIHIYVDDTLFDYVWANAWRPDVAGGSYHGFVYYHPGFGKGTHHVKAFAIGVNSSGQADGSNTLLPNSPRFVSSSCANLVASAVDWCNNASSSNYWVNRQRDTKILMNDYVKVGIDNSYGGSIMQLYSNDRSFNLIDEHGGAAIQLSVWGGDSNNTHLTVADCIPSMPQAPWNPIQAQARNCLWDDPSNDVDAGAYAPTSNSWYVKKTAPNNFTKNTGGFTGMTFQQTTTLQDTYVAIKHVIDYSGPYYLGITPQEIPAIQLSIGPNPVVYWHGPSNPAFTRGPVQSFTLTRGFGSTTQDVLRLAAAGRGIPGHPGTAEGVSDEGWYSVCNSSGSRCVTIAYLANNTLVQEANISFGNNTNSQNVYASLLGWFYIRPTAGYNHYETTAYVFPYRYDRVINGLSIRDRIYQLNGR